MLGRLIRVLLLFVVLVAAVAFFLGYRSTSLDSARRDESSGAVGTSGIDTAKARAAGAAIAERAAVGASRLEEAAEDGVLTSKIKAKMALDDTVKALAIDVDTHDGVVTLSGRVSSADERERALRLAKETAGVGSVVDHLEIR